jgi:hypothetical protein
VGEHRPGGRLGHALRNAATAVHAHVSHPFLCRVAVIPSAKIGAQDPRVTVRLTALDTRKCWQSVFDTGTTKKNVVTQFTAVLK